MCTLIHGFHTNIPQFYPILQEGISLDQENKELRMDLLFYLIKENILIGKNEKEHHKNQMAHLNKTHTSNERLLMLSTKGKIIRFCVF